MAGKAGTLEVLAQQIGLALQPLEEQLKPERFLDLLAELGLRLPAQVLTPGVLSALNTGSSAAGTLRGKLTQLAADIAGDNTAAIAASGAAALVEVKKLIGALSPIGAALGAGAGALPGMNAAEVTAFANDLPKNLLGHLVVGRLESALPSFVGVSSLLGIIDYVPDLGVPRDPTHPAFVLKRLQLGNLGTALSAPKDLLKSRLKWGAPDFNGSLLIPRLADALSLFGMRSTVIGPGPPEFIDAGMFTIAVNKPPAPPGLNLKLNYSVPANFEVTLPLTKVWSLKLTSRGSFAAGLSASLTPPSVISITPAAGTKPEGLAVSLIAKNPSPIVVLGQAEGSRFQAETITFSSGLDVSPGSGAFTAQPGIKLKIEGGKALIDTGDADSFIGKILSGLKLETNCDFDLDFSLDRGLRFGTSSGLETQLAAHVQLGPVSVDAVTLKVGIENGKFPIGVTADLSTSFGPFDAVVQGLGFELVVAVAGDNDGNVGLLDIQPHFKPPHGIGLSMDAGGFKGGGFLSFDEARGEYAGALELDFCGMFSVKAIGVINTKLPDGSPGFSMVIVIAAEFVPIQLSFGFTLNGVGGIFGLNRTICVQALADGIRTNAIKSILFPDNVIANITRIISDIKQFFPPQPDHFVVGPMAKLGWGTPSLITVELGLLLDLPDPMFAIVGVLKCVLPAEEAPLLRLQVNFVGVMDFDHGYLFFRADLYDSRLLFLQITGSMALLVSWGDEQTFALSVGGFHPDFRDFPSIPALPDGFRGMSRIGINLWSGDNPRLKADSYFAVTSNTVQFGAHVELYAAAMGFNVYGFLGYDVLFQFDPFHFIARLDGGIALREGTEVIAGINISAQLSGPNPFDARGDATLTILLLEVTVSFHVTFGDPPPAIPAATEDLLTRLQGELADTRNWRAELPANNHLHVTVRKIEPPVGTELVVIHPAGVLTFSQRSMPLENYLIEKFGNRRPLADNKFKLDNANCGGMPLGADFQGTREQFAPGNFTNLSDSDKLSRHSFELLPSGFRLTAAQDLQGSKPEVREVDYELTYLRKDVVDRRGKVKLGTGAYKSLVTGSAVRQSSLAHQQTRPSLNAPPQPELPHESYAVADVADLKSHLTEGSGPVLFATQSEAYQRQRELLEANPALAGRIQVVSNYELS
jgi:hypothetical protein